MLRRDLLAAFAAAERPVPPSILVHEHILVDFIGAAKIAPGRYDRDEAFRIALPKLQEIRSLGCRRLLECTPNFLGRDPQLLTRLARAAGLELWTNTGLYGARQFEHLPEYAKTETPEQLAARWTAEHRQGVDGVRPRFIKIGVNNGPLHPLDRKLMAAAILTSKATGLTIAVHTGDGRAALDQLEMVEASGLNPAKWVWVHAQNERDHAVHERVARAGAWVEFDGISARTHAWNLSAVEHMARRNLLGRVLLSQDSGWYHVGEPGGGRYNGYAYILKDFVPALDARWRRQLMWENPRRAFGR
jgi:phosphotriesterase-related protein